jgi:hypothetical protein
MGWDLRPINPSPDAPREPETGEPVWGQYNISGWEWLNSHLVDWGVDTSEFSGFNGGDVISAETCLKVADAIEQNLVELDEEHREWIESHIVLWRTCGGYEQW